MSEVPRDVLIWIVLGLTAWLAIGVLTATLFGALVSTSESGTPSAQQRCDASGTDQHPRP
jgi:hypothetical protein